MNQVNHIDVSAGDALPNILFARYYGSSLGRFLSPDQLGGSPRNPKTLNRYAYVRNNPISRLDPDGHRDEYLHHSATKRAIVDVFRRYNKKVDNETGTSAYITKAGKTKLLKATGGKSHAPNTGPAGRGKGEVAVDVGSNYVGSAHFHPDGDTRPSLPGDGSGDLMVFLANNRAIGIEPVDDPEAAVDGYIVTPDGNVYRYNIGVTHGEKVTTVKELEKQLTEEEAADGKSDSKDDGSTENKSSAPPGQLEGICIGATSC